MFLEALLKVLCCYDCAYWGVRVKCLWLGHGLEEIQDIWNRVNIGEDIGTLKN